MESDTVGNISVHFCDENLFSGMYEQMLLERSTFVVSNLMPECCRVTGGIFTHAAPVSDTRAIAKKLLNTHTLLVETHILCK